MDADARQTAYVWGKPGSETYQVIQGQFFDFTKLSWKRLHFEVSQTFKLFRLFYVQLDLTRSTQRSYNNIRVLSLSTVICY
jgi:hypothetical protein